MKNNFVIIDLFCLCYKRMDLLFSQSGAQQRGFGKARKYVNGKGN